MHTLGELYTHYRRYPTVCTDTRNILENSIFFALKGERFNGNAFAAEALESGARYAVIDEPEYQTDKRMLLVPDVLEALQALATHHRNQLHIPVIGVTGTNGKTTTKELLHAVLSRSYNTFATKGNLNNHIGVPLSLLSIPEDTQLAIIEMGANHQGEIQALCKIAQPTHGLITNVGKAHLEGFGSFEGVMKAKGELYNYLATNGGFVFIRGDNPLLESMANKRGLFSHELATDRMSYGLVEGNDLVGRLQDVEPPLRIQWHTADDTTWRDAPSQLTGAYNAENILAAISVGLHFDVSETDIATAIATYSPSNNRSQISKSATNTVIRDYYNANASSMAAALDNLAQLRASAKVAILGDMFEMGADTFDAHHAIVEQARRMPLARRIFVGKAFYEHHDSHDEFYETTAAAMLALAENPVRDALVLLKASRGMAFEKLIDLL